MTLVLSTVGDGHSSKSLNCLTKTVLSPALRDLRCTGDCCTNIDNTCFMNMNTKVKTECKLWFAQSHILNGYKLQLLQLIVVLKDFRHKKRSGVM